MLALLFLAAMALAPRASFAISRPARVPVARMRSADAIAARRGLHGLPKSELPRAGAVLADEPLDVRDLVEDAVLLALPMIPRKPGSEAVAPPGPEEGPGTSPFAALERLRKK